MATYGEAPSDYSRYVQEWLNPTWKQGDETVQAGLGPLRALLTGGKLPGGEEYLKGAERNFQGSRNRMLARLAAMGGSGFGGVNGVDQSNIGNTELARGEQMSRAGLDYQQAMSERMRNLLLPLMSEQNQLYGQAMGKTVVKKQGKRKLIQLLHGIGSAVIGGFTGNSGAMQEGLRNVGEYESGGPVTYEGAGGPQYDTGWGTYGGSAAGGGGGGGGFEGFGSLTGGGNKKQQKAAWSQLPSQTQQYGVYA